MARLGYALVFPVNIIPLLRILIPLLRDLSSPVISRVLLPVRAFNIVDRKVSTK